MEKVKRRESEGRGKEGEEDTDFNHSVRTIYM